MYRSSGSVSVLSGVLSGPYAGGTKTLDATLIEDATRARLERALSGRGAPEPIAYDRPKIHGWFNPTWGVIIATILIVVVFAVGFGNLDSTFAIQPPSFVVIYLALGGVFALSLIRVLWRRALVGSAALRPGRYLFPLDAVDVSLPDPNGRQTLTVRPLGDARDAAIEEKGRQTDLVIRFEGGEFVRWPLRGDPHGEIALRRLERAQRLLEELSFSAVLDHAFTNDLFFEVRVDKSWDKLAPGRASATVRVPTVLTRYAPLVGAVIALGFGGGAYLLRSSAGDVALFEHAVTYGSAEALERYLALGGKHRAEAEAMIQARADEAKKRAADEQAEAERERAEEQVDVRDVENDQKCIQSLHDLASKTHRRTTPVLVDNIQFARVAQDRVVFVDFERHGDTEATLPLLLADERAFTNAFARVVSEMCPASVLRFTNDGSQGYGAHIAIDYTVTQAAKPWMAGDASADGARPEDFNFVVALRRRGDSDVDAFALKLPAPATAPLQPRERSIITPLPTLSASLVDVVNAAQTARAFDRLYDEVWSLFFAGDPRVPLKEPAAVLTP